MQSIFSNTERSELCFNSKSVQWERDLSSIKIQSLTEPIYQTRSLQGLNYSFKTNHNSYFANLKSAYMGTYFQMWNLFTSDKNLNF